MMGTIKPSKDQALVSRDLKVDSKRKKKAKNPPEQKRDKNKSPEEPQGSKKNHQKKKNKGEMSKCTYYSKGNHTKSSCMKKQIDMLTQLLEKNGISLPDISKKRGGSSSNEREREFMHWLLAHQAHLVSSLILELQDIWFRSRRRHSPHLTCQKVHQYTGR